MVVLIKLVNTMWCSLVIKRAFLTGLFILNHVGVRNHWWRHLLLSAWNMGMTHFLFSVSQQLFLPSFLSGFRSVVCSLLGLFVRFVSILCLFCIYFPPRHVFRFFPFISALCAQKIQSSITSQKILAWHTLLIEKSGRGKNKKRFPQLPRHGRPFNCSVCLSASWLCSASTHPGTSINASCYAATVYTHSSPR